MEVTVSSLVSPLPLIRNHPNIGFNSRKILCSSSFHSRFQKIHNISLELTVEAKKRTPNSSEYSKDSTLRFHVCCVSCTCALFISISLTTPTFYQSVYRRYITIITVNMAKNWTRDNQLFRLCRSHCIALLFCIAFSEWWVFHHPLFEQFTSNDFG